MSIVEFVSPEIYQQFIVLGLLGVGLMLFIKDRFRYDVVALFLMVAVIILGILPYETALANFGHPVIIIVGSMFIMSSALVHSGIIDVIVGRISFLHHRPVLALFILIIVVTIISGFVNNIGALAMVIPIALHLAHKSGTSVAFFLLPLAFASHLGGYLTLIGTPRNILISNFRAEATGEPFAMFDFFYVGGAIACAGVLFLGLHAWRWYPKTRTGHKDGLAARSYVTEISIPPLSKVAGLTIAKFHSKTKDLVTVEQIFRNTAILPHNDTSEIRTDDVILLSGTEENLTQIIEKFKLELTGLRAFEQHITNADDYISVEVVVPPYAKNVTSRTWDNIPLRDRFGTNFIGLFRRNLNLTHPLSLTKLLGNDILLLQGRTESVEATICSLGLLPLANSHVHLGRTTTIVATVSIVLGAIILATLAIAPLPLIFLVAVMLLIGLNLISLKVAYESVDWPVLVLLAGMITLGEALQASGAADSLANFILIISNVINPISILALILISSMLLSDFINTTASAVIMAPIGIIVANGIGASIDPFLIAVAIGASSAFLTPVGHESNALVMQKGGYRFSDFTKVGLPLELIIIAISLPLILHFWPL